MIKEEKNALRKIIKEKRQSLKKEYMQDASRKITDAVISSKLFRNADRIFVYISMDDEPDTKGIIEAAFAAGKTVCS